MDHESVTTTIRVNGPDGSATETEVNDHGRVEVTERAPDGSEATRVVSEFDRDGLFERTIHRPGHPPEPFEPTDASTRINNYGATVESLQYPDGVKVEAAFDDDGHLRTTEVSAVWGVQTMHVRADGGRTLSWETPFHDGSRTWAAGGVENRYEVTFADGSGHTREVIDDEVRVTTVDRTGHTDVNREAVTRGSG